MNDLFLGAIAPSMINNEFLGIKENKNLAQGNLEEAGDFSSILSEISEKKEEFGQNLIESENNLFRGGEFPKKEDLNQSHDAGELKKDSIGEAVLLDGEIESKKIIPTLKRTVLSDESKSDLFKNPDMIDVELSNTQNSLKDDLGIKNNLVTLKHEKDNYLKTKSDNELNLNPLSNEKSEKLISGIVNNLKMKESKRKSQDLNSSSRRALLTNSLSGININKNPMVNNKIIGVNSSHDFIKLNNKLFNKNKSKDLTLGVVAKDEVSVDFLGENFSQEEGSIHQKDLSSRVAHIVSGKMQLINNSDGPVIDISNENFQSTEKVIETISNYIVSNYNKTNSSFSLNLKHDDFGSMKIHLEDKGDGQIFIKILTSDKDVANEIKNSQSLLIEKIESHGFDVKNINIQNNSDLDQSDIVQKKSEHIFEDKGSIFVSDKFIDSEVREKNSQDFENHHDRKEKNEHSQGQKQKNKQKKQYNHLSQGRDDESSNR